MCPFKGFYELSRHTVVCRAAQEAGVPHSCGPHIPHLNHDGHFWDMNLQNLAEYFIHFCFSRHTGKCVMQAKKPACHTHELLTAITIMQFSPICSSVTLWWNQIVEMLAKVTNLHSKFKSQAFLTFKIGLVSFSSLCTFCQTIKLTIKCKCIIRLPWYLVHRKVA